MINFKIISTCLLFAFLFSCNKRIEISVIEDGVLEFNLTKGYGTILNRKGKVDTFQFHVKKEELQKLNEIYFKNKLNQYPAEKFVDPENSDFILPIEKTRINIISGNNIHFIQYNDDGGMNSYERINDHKVKEFFIEIGKITKRINDSTHVRSQIYIL